MPTFRPSNPLATLLMILALFIAVCQVTVADPVNIDATSLEPPPNALQYLEDPDGSLTLEEVSSPAFDHRFRQNESDVPRFGRTRSTYWLRLPVVHNNDHDHYLLIDHPIIGTAQLYTVPIATKQGSEPSAHGEFTLPPPQQPVD